MNLNNYRYQNGISPVIGVILLVAIVVSLVVLASVLVFNIGSGVTDSSDASIDFSQTSDGVSVQVISNNNVDEFRVLFPDGTEQTLSSEVGSSLNLIGPEGTYSVVAVMNDGTEEVLTTRHVDELDYSGVFIVLQDEEEGEVEATLSQEFDNVEDYDLELEENDEGDEEVTLQSFEYESGHTLLSDQLVNEDNTLTRGERISLMRITSNLGIDTVEMESFGGDETIEADVTYVGETIQVHELTNLCPGDELILTESETNDDLASEEIIVDNDCGDLRKVMRYLNGEITAAELINLWNLELDYSVFAYDGQPQPELPTSPVPEDEDGIDVVFTIVEKESGDIISNANVAFGDRIQQTNSDGKTTFTNVDPGVELISTNGNTIDATAYKEGYRPAPVITIPEEEWENNSEEEFTYEQELELEKYSLQPTSHESNNIPSREGTIYNFDTSYSSGGGVSISGGSGGGSSIGTISGGGGFYSSGGSSPATFSTSSPVSPPEYNFVQPERSFNVIPIDESLIPTDVDFEVRTSVAANDEDLSDTVNVYAIKTDNENADFDEENKIGSSNINIPAGDNTVDEQKLSISEVGEYTIYVSLEEIDDYQVAGSLDVFDGAREDATIESGTIEPTNANTGEEVTVTITQNDIDFNNADAVTADIFKNGVRVAEGEIANPDSNYNADTELVYKETFNNSQYVQFHGGIQESQDVAIFGTSIITDTPPVDTGVNSFNTEIELNTVNEYDCDLDIRTSGQFDCEVETGNTTHELWFDATKSNYDLTDVNTDDVDRLEFQWVIGSEDSKSVEYTGSELDRFINNGHMDEEFVEDFKFNNSDDGHIFTEDTVHMVEFRAELDINEQEYGSTEALFVNALDEPGQESTRIRGTDVTSENRVTVNLKNDQETVTDDVELQFYDGHEVVNDVEGEEPLRTKQLRVRPEESKNIGTTFTVDDILEFNDVEDFEEGDNIPITIKLDKMGEEENDYFAEINLNGPDVTLIPNIQLIEQEEYISTEEFEVLIDEDETAPAGEISSISWDFDDGTTIDDAEPNQKHIYDKGGVYTISVEVEDEYGVVATDELTIDIQHSGIATITAENERGQETLSGGTGEEIDYTIIPDTPPEVDDSKLEYRFTFDDSEEKETTDWLDEDTYTHQWTETGEHIVKAEIRDNDEYFETETIEVDIQIRESCRRILENDPDAESGVYSVVPEGFDEVVDVQCDMEYDGGGWTLVLAANGMDSSGSHSNGGYDDEGSDDWNTNKQFKTDGAEFGTLNQDSRGEGWKLSDEMIDQIQFDGEGILRATTLDLEQFNNENSNGDPVRRFFESATYKHSTSVEDRSESEVGESYADQEFTEYIQGDSDPHESVKGLADSHYPKTGYGYLTNHCHGECFVESDTAIWVK